MKKIVKFFVQGLIYTVPLFITIYIVFKIFELTYDLIPFENKWLGALAILALITFVGYLGSTFIVQPVFIFFDRIIERAPLIKIIYTSVRDLMGAFVGTKRKFNQPVLVNMNSEGSIQKLGFITREDLSSMGIEGDRVAVYLPHSYNFSGNLFVVPRENIRPISGNSAEVMKFIVSGGVS